MNCEVRKYPEIVVQGVLDSLTTAPAKVVRSPEAMEAMASETPDDQIPTYFGKVVKQAFSDVETSVEFMPEDLFQFRNLKDRMLLKWRFLMARKLMSSDSNSNEYPDPVTTAFIRSCARALVKTMKFVDEENRHLAEEFIHRSFDDVAKEMKIGDGKEFIESGRDDPNAMEFCMLQERFRNEWESEEKKLKSQ